MEVPMTTASGIPFNECLFDNSTMMGSVNLEDPGMLHMDPLIRAKNIVAIWTLCYYHIYSVTVLVTQTMTIAVVFRFREFRTPANAFIVSLSVSDFIQFLPLATIPHVQKQQSDSAVHVLGSISIFLHVLSSTMSLTTLTVIAVDRFHAIRNPLKHKAEMTMQRALVVIFWSWIVGSVVPVLILCYTIQKSPAFLRYTLAVSAMVVHFYHLA